MIEIYTDGAYNQVKEQGGWAAVLVENGKKQSYSGNVGHTTSQRMEITAAIEGISRTPKGAELAIYTDSQYLYGCAARGWQRRANRDLWEKLDAEASQRKVKWEWINGDSDNPFHQEAHNLATGNTSEKGKASPEVETPVAAELSHIDSEGRPRMVDVTGKPDTEREAVAKCVVKMQPETLAKIMKGDISKGNVLTTAQLAGIMAAKQTPSLIPLCHPLLLGKIDVELEPNDKDSTIEITARVKSTGKTGVEMEALTAAAVAALTVYDMCKSIDRGMRMDNLRLVRKSGGKSGGLLVHRSCRL